jgi:hypothetical protein
LDCGCVERFMYSVDLRNELFAGIDLSIRCCLKAFA